MNLYRISYAWPDGRQSQVSMASPESQILRRAAEYVRCFARGELLEIREERPIVREPVQLELTP